MVPHIDERDRFGYVTPGTATLVLDRASYTRSILWGVLGMADSLAFLNHEITFRIAYRDQEALIVSEAQQIFFSFRVLQSVFSR